MKPKHVSFANLAPIQTEITQPKIQRDGFFYVKIRTMPAPRNETNIICQLNQLQSVFLHSIGNDIFEYAKTFNLLKEKERLQAFLNSSLMKAHLLSWEENIGVHYLEKSDTKILENKVCIQIKYDKIALPTFLKISFKSQHIESSIKIDLMEAFNLILEIIDEDLTCLRNLSTVMHAINECIEKLHVTNNEIQHLHLYEFNQKWRPQLNMTYEIDQTQREGICKVQTMRGTILVTDCSKININLKNETCQLASVANTCANFWRQHPTIVATGTLALGALASAAVYSLSV